MQFIIMAYDGNDEKASERRMTHREALDAYLSVEPYVIGKVWETIEIKPCKVGPMFLGVS